MRTWGWKWKTPRRENKTFRRPFHISVDGSGIEKSERNRWDRIEQGGDSAEKGRREKKEARHPRVNSDTCWRY